MKKIYEKYFHTEENQKMREEVFLARIIFSVILIVFFAISTVITAYAFFSSDASSESNVFSAAKFGITVEVDGIELSDAKLNAAAGTEYTVRITPTGNAKTGFCVITVNNALTYHTAQLDSTTTVTPYDTRESITFKIICANDCTITFSPHWGTSIYYPEFSYNGPGSQYYIESKDPAVTVNIPAVTPPLGSSTPPETNEPETNEPTTTVPETDTPNIIHTVKSGETLFTIALKYDTTVEILMDVNSIADPNLIYAGQKLEIPS